MIKDVINDFRVKQGCAPAEDGSCQDHENCKWHCLYMARNYSLAHATDHLRPGKAEIVAGCDFLRNMQETENFLIWQVIANSPGHRSILLGSRYLAHYLLIDRYRAYLTIRGWS